MALSDDYLWEQAVQATIGGDVHIIKFARAIETEVRKEYTELIRQMRSVLEFLESADISLHASGWGDLNAAITAANARLENT